MHSLLATFLLAIYCLTFAFTITPQPMHLCRLCDLLGGADVGSGDFQCCDCGGATAACSEKAGAETAATSSTAIGPTCTADISKIMSTYGIHIYRSSIYKLN